MPDESSSSHWRVEFYTTESGRSPVLEYINGLEASERAEIRNALRLLREFGTALSLPHVRHLQDKLWELRPGRNRLLYFVQTGRCFVVVHAFRKQTGKTPKREIDVALRRMARCL